MSEKNIIFSNVVATPTLNSWAQAYNAGKLFAVLSLRKESQTEEPNEDETLSAIGKKILNSLEQEFFTLENKDLKSIKGAIEITVQKIPHDIKSSFVVSAIVGNVLYVFVLNKGRVNIKRENKVGAIIDGEKDEDKLKAASGYLKDQDIIILQTEQFTTLVPESTLSSSLDHQPPGEISEILAPLVHEGEEGGAAAIIIAYKEDQEPVQEEVLKEEKEEKEPEEILPYEQKEEDIVASTPERKVKMPKISLPHSKKVFLTIALVILIVLVSGIFLAVKKQADSKTKATFNQYYPQASKKYDEGQALVDLNQSLATDSFKSAQDLLNQAKSKLPANSNEEKQVEALLQKVNKNLETPKKTAANLDRTKITVSVENGSGVVGAASKIADFLKSKGYQISSTGNADNYNYTNITIQTKSSTSTYVDLLKKDLSQNYTVSSTTSDLPSSSTEDVLVIVGK
jgi:hypothetical protein